MLSAEEISADVFGPRLVWPHLGELIDREVEQRARTLADELHLDMVEAEIERRVDEELASRAAEAEPPSVVAAAQSRMASADHGDGTRYEPRYEPQVGLRRRYRSRFVAG
jgi:hypothetical protein